MKLAMIGQGRMGEGMTRRLRAAGHDVVAYDLDPAKSDVPDLPAMVAALPSPRIVWVMGVAARAGRTFTKVWDDTREVVPLWMVRV